MGHAASLEKRDEWCYRSEFFFRLEVGRWRGRGALEAGKDQNKPGPATFIL